MTTHAATDTLDAERERRIVLRDYVVHGYRDGKPLAIRVENTTIGRAALQAGLSLPVTVVPDDGCRACSQAVSQP